MVVDLEETGQVSDLDKPLKVIYDLIVEGNNGDEIIVDLKKAKCRFGKNKTRWDMQPTFYLLARGVSAGVHIPRTFRYNVLLKKEDSRINPVSHIEG